MRLLTLSTNLFPVWVVAGGVLALLHPPLFTWFKGDAIIWGLAIVMLGMGVTLSIDDFKAVAKMPKAVATGFVAQYTIMPFLGATIAHLAKLEEPYAVGLILVACCPGGTASNVVTYLARADVALSVLMTMCTTFAAIIMTPLLTKLLVGKMVNVDAWGLFWSTVQVVLLPLVIGLLLNHYCKEFVSELLPFAPLVSVVVIALICASIIGQNAIAVKASGAKLLLAIAGLHVGGFLIGYVASRTLGYDKIRSRTISIEVGMQNSGLGVVLAKQHFINPLTPVPSAISSVFHSVIGSILAGYWRLKKKP